MECTRRDFLKGAGGLVAALLVSPSIVFAGNRYEERLSELKNELYQELDSLMKISGSLDAYSEKKHFASIITKLFSKEKDCKDAQKALERDIDATRGKDETDQDLENIPIIDSSTRVKLAKEYEEITEKYSKELLKLAKTFDRKKQNGLKKKTIETILTLNPNHKDTRRFLDDQYVPGYFWVDTDIARKLRTQRQYKGKWISEREAKKIHSDWKTPWTLESEHFIVKSNADEKQAVTLLESAEQYYDFFTQEFGRYFQVTDVDKKIEINHMPVKEYKEACKNRLIFEDMRSFADKEKVYIRQLDENDKEFLDSWQPLRSQEDVMREALFNLFCYKRLVRSKEDKEALEPFHTDNYDRLEEFCMLRGLSVFFSSKPKISHPSKPSENDAYRVYEVPETDEILHSNFLRLYRNKTPSLKPLRKRTASPEHDTAMWGRFNFDYFKEGEYHPINRKKLHLLSKWVFENSIDGDKFQREHLCEKYAKESAEYIRSKKR